VEGGDRIFGNEGKLALLTSRFGVARTVKGGDEGFVIGVKLKRTAFEVRSEMEEGLVGSEELLVKSGVFLLGGGEFGREEGEGLPVVVVPLLENCADVSVGGVGSKGDGGGRMRMGKKGGMGQCLFDGGEGGGHIGGEEKGSGFVGKGISERTEDSGGLRDETAVEVNETEETLQILEGGGGWKIEDGGDMGLEGGDTGGGKVVTQEVKVDAEAVGAEDGEKVAEMVGVISDGGTGDEDVIEVDENVGEVLKEVVHEALEGLG